MSKSTSVALELSEFNDDLLGKSSTLRKGQAINNMVQLTSLTGLVAFVEKLADINVPLFGQYFPLLRLLFPELLLLDWIRTAFLGREFIKVKNASRFTEFMLELGKSVALTAIIVAVNLGAFFLKPLIGFVISGGLFANSTYNMIMYKRAKDRVKQAEFDSEEKKYFEKQTTVFLNRSLVSTGLGFGILGALAIPMLQISAQVTGIIHTIGVVIISAMWGLGAFFNKKSIDEARSSKEEISMKPIIRKQNAPLSTLTIAKKLEHSSQDRDLVLERINPIHEENNQVLLTFHSDLQKKIRVVPTPEIAAQTIVALIDAEEFNVIQDIKKDNQKSHLFTRLEYIQIAAIQDKRSNELTKREAKLLTLHYLKHLIHALDAEQYTNLEDISDPLAQEAIFGNQQSLSEKWNALRKYLNSNGLLGKAKQSFWHEEGEGHMQKVLLTFNEFCKRNEFLPTEEMLPKRSLLHSIKI